MADKACDQEQRRVNATKTDYRMPDLIMTKRDGGKLSSDQINWFIVNMLAGAVDDSQVGAMLMAMYLRGMTQAETSALTKSMTENGEVLHWPQSMKGLLVDKHSTGGIGDKISLPLAPALAVCGMKVPMISGRGLGHTGGTLDKLESIPNYSVIATAEKMTAILNDVGCCIVGQTSNIVPADKKLYATRDVTSTVDSLALITASIVSKKAAESIDALILDVKVGKAAFMKTKDEARQLAQSMVSASTDLGIKTTALLTEMDNPIGYTAGNALEVAEAVQCLQGHGPEDLKELVCHLGGYLIHSQDKSKYPSPQDGISAIQASLQDGSACNKFMHMLTSQGVTEDDAYRLCKPQLTSIDDVWGVLKRSQFTTGLETDQSGFVQAIDAMELGKVILELGAGRSTAGESIDHSVGFRLAIKVGTKLEQGQEWIYVYHNTSPLSTNHVARLQSSLAVGPEEVVTSSRICEVIGAE